MYVIVTYEDTVIFEDSVYEVLVEPNKVTLDLPNPDSCLTFVGGPFQVKVKSQYGD